MLSHVSAVAHLRQAVALSSQPKNLTLSVTSPLHTGKIQNSIGFLNDGVPVFLVGERSRGSDKKYCPYPIKTVDRRTRNTILKVSVSLGSFKQALIFEN
jgi:hypothetical protein